jgi:hypothetical protein
MWMLTLLTLRDLFTPNCETTLPYEHYETHAKNQNATAKIETPTLGRESARVACFGPLQTDSILLSRVREH